MFYKFFTGSRQFTSVIYRCISSSTMMTSSEATMLQCATVEYKADNVPSGDVIPSTMSAIPTDSKIFPECPGTKRELPADEVIDCKKLKTEENEQAENAWPFRKKKVALLLVYSGKGYMGMQKNPGYRTIESDLLEALVKAGCVRPDHIEQPGIKMAFQRAARTDKGVSAAGQVVSLKMFVDLENPVEKINENLVPQIRVVGLKRTTKGFDSKNACCARTYIYVTPTFAFAPIDQMVQTSYRVTDDVLQMVQEILDLYKGSHRFHNFTSGKKPNDPSAQRYIKDFRVGRPFEKDNMEFVVLTVVGQSFMLHQIRKMVGLTAAICRGYASKDMIKKSWEPDKLDIPKAPGLGLVLHDVHYDKYNRKFGSDGVHEAIEWEKYKEQIERFKESFIYSSIYSTEKEEQPMMKWLATLPLHHFDIVHSHTSRVSPIAHADQLVTNLGVSDNDKQQPTTGCETEIDISHTVTTRSQEEIDDVSNVSDASSCPAPISMPSLSSKS